MADKTLNQCPDFGPEKPWDLDVPNPDCATNCETQPSNKDVNTLFDDIIHTDRGIGREHNCDPMQSGQIINDLSKAPNRNTIFRYSKGIRGCDEAMKDMFSDLVVIDELGVAHPVPIIWSTQERAVAAVVQQNVRKDTSLVVDRVSLPMLSIYSNNFTFNQSRFTYHQAFRPAVWMQEERAKDTVFGIARGIPIDIGYSLTIWTYFVEDMNQILEQILLKFSPIAYITIQGVQWETIVKIESIASNVDTEPGNTANRVVKFQIGMTVETYVPQPIVRQKTVLKTRVECVDGLSDSDITEIIERLEVAVKE